MPMVDHERCELEPVHNFRDDSGWLQPMTVDLDAFNASFCHLQMPFTLYNQISFSELPKQIPIVALALDRLPLLLDSPA